MKSVALIVVAILIDANLASAGCMDEDQCRQNIGAAVGDAQRFLYNMSRSTPNTQIDVLKKQVKGLKNSIITGPEQCRKFFLAEETFFYIQEAMSLCPMIKIDMPSDETIAAVSYFPKDNSTVMDEKTRNYYCKHITLYQNYYCKLYTSQMDFIQKCDVWGVISALHEKDWRQCVKNQ